MRTSWSCRIVYSTTVRHSNTPHITPPEKDILADILQNKSGTHNEIGSLAKIPSIEIDVSSRRLIRRWAFCFLRLPSGRYDQRGNSADEGFRRFIDSTIQYHGYLTYWYGPGAVYASTALLDDSSRQNHH